MTKWYEKTGKDIDVVMATRVSFSRNIDKYPYVSKLKMQDKVEICEKVKTQTDSAYPNRFKNIKMSDITQDEAISLAEKGLVSAEFVSNVDGKSLLLQEDESISIMLCEEDHIKIQGILSGLELDKVYSFTEEIETELDKNLQFAFDKDLGYLTQCPTNIGTAMKASVLLHLPALTANRQMSKLLTTVSKLGLTLAGVYGDISNPKSYIYLLSNQVTLGISEKSAIENLSSITAQIIEQERAAREKMLGDLRYQDVVWRSCGTLQNARILSFDEFIHDISNVRMASTQGTLNIPIEKINSLIITMQPATINVSKGARLDRQERDAIRAEKVREIF
ncbi:MAG: ATP--guanido phosphotransferase [Clostridiales bacterium]|nr:ATP--guanido phosphotransferase [Clostridiales bacterium]